jgi:DNA-binding CsgD family transcriptional regulator
MHTYPRYPSHTALQVRFGLTTAEAEIAQAIANGAGLQAVATARGVSIQTVRSQMKAIFRKVGVKSQVQLVSLVLR